MTKLPSTLTSIGYSHSFGTDDPYSHSSMAEAMQILDMAIAATEGAGPVDWSAVFMWHGEAETRSQRSRRKRRARYNRGRTGIRPRMRGGR